MENPLNPSKEIIKLIKDTLKAATRPNKKDISDVPTYSLSLHVEKIQIKSIHHLTHTSKTRQNQFYTKFHVNEELYTMAK
ncbi:unnamed protein product [Didymodactylos carnosus]|uniref:Uncharacterized protein n=1 Tax=Didymodactylos carnosus TaxID=1234261 RepID=A0A814SRC0_9BILA|nr:unnamed protein product [Didymodactylos carnosus]CAF3912926.1 unnamed protein product [Didymodactylos carnosus]